MDKFLEEYNGASVEDDLTVNSREMISFSRKFKNYLKRNLPELDIKNYSTGHYSVSCFFKKDADCVYLSYNVPRYGEKIDIVNGCWYTNQAVLIRKAKNEEDYQGETNRFCSLKDIPQAVRGLFA